MTAAVVTTITNPPPMLAQSKLDCIRGELLGARLALHVAWLHAHGDREAEQLLRAVAAPLRTACERFQVQP
jgi:hypothetical protein